MNALLCCQPVAAAAAALRDAAESSPSNADALTTRAGAWRALPSCAAAAVEHPHLTRTLRLCHSCLR
eukprot:4785366-Pleurochrysis_carterae.AAC.1